MATRKKPLDPKFGELLKFLRQRAKVTLEKLALKSDLDIARLSRMEKGDYPAPDLPVLEKIADCLEIKPSEWRNLFEFSVANRTPDLYDSLILHGVKRRMSEQEFKEWMSSYHSYKENPYRVLPLTEADRHTREAIANTGQVIESAFLVYRVSDPRLGNRIEFLVADVQTEDVKPKKEGRSLKLFQRILPKHKKT